MTAIVRPPGDGVSAGSVAETDASGADDLSYPPSGFSTPHDRTNLQRGDTMNENAYRARAERGELQIGTWITMVRAPAVLTLLKAARLDYARVDMEHSPFSMETIADMAILARALDFPMVVRPPDGNRDWITRLLDAGMWNLHIPQVDTPEEAAEVAACTRYAPLGQRGMYGFSPATEYQRLTPAELMSGANARVHVTAMLETTGAFDRLDEIGSVPGIDALTIGLRWVGRGPAGRQTALHAS